MRIIQLCLILSILVTIIFVAIIDASHLISMFYTAIALIVVFGDSDFNSVAILITFSFSSSDNILFRGYSTRRTVDFFWIFPPFAPFVPFVRRKIVIVLIRLFPVPGQYQYNRNGIHFVDVFRFLLGEVRCGRPRVPRHGA